MEQQNVMDIKDLGRILRKRKWTILIPAVSLFIVIALVAYLLPAIYKSETMILIENQKIPTDYVQSTVTSEVEERLNVINQRLMSRTRLEKIINKFNLYPEYRKDWTREEIINKMREDINLEVVSAEGVDKKSGRPVTFTVAFKLSYEGKDPATVQKVCSELASFYIEENLKLRVDTSAMTTRFVSDEMKKMEEEIRKVGKTIAEYKEKHQNELPEQLMVNMQNLDRYERYLETNHRDLQNAKSSLVFLRGQLAETDPDATMISSYGKRVLSPKEQLELDRTQLITLESKLSPHHPDVLAMKKEIARLEKEVQTDDVDTLKQSLSEKEAELATLRAKYSGKHPDVIRVSGEVRDLKNRIQQIRKTQGGEASEYAVDPTNPAYISLQTQIESKKLEIVSLQQQEKQYKKVIEFYQQRIANTPTVEKALAALQSDYDVARTNYQELMNKETQAKISESMENRQEAERFTIIDPAQLPEEPYKPNRMAILFIGLILGVGAGAGSGFLAEYMDQSFSSVEDLRSFSELPVLAVIPKVVTGDEIQHRKKRRRILFASLLIILVALLVVVQIFFFKFDIFFIKLFREARKFPIQ
ncbi:MAG: lipopolysaccharide biosynthesis protein [Deltaproteobacteria bacterium]|nr:lipopolysaccharide biosynthesis protein [Deltaproteobacteria bacterium]